MPNLRNDTLLETDESQYLLVDGTRTATSLVVEGSSASTLLRITQTGAGNALLVEDSSNPDSTPFVVDASGYVGIGTTTPFQPATYGSLTVDGSGGSIYSGRVNGTETFRIQSTSLSTTINGIANLPLLIHTNNTERMRIDSSGQVGIGSATAAGYNILAGKNFTGATSTYGMVIQGQIQSDSTSSATTFASAPSTAAAAFTVGTLNHFSAVGISTPGAGSALTNQIGFNAGSGISGATNNFGFSGNISSGTGRYNLYMSGTAANYLAGRLGVGATNTGGQMAAIVNTTAGDYALLIKGAVSQTGDLLNIQNSAGTLLSRIDSSGTIFDIGSNVTTQSVVIQLGNARSGNGYSYIDLVGDATYTDYGLRLMRENTGANTNSFLTHRGTGALYLTAFDTGSVAIQTNSVTRMTVNSVGEVGVGSAPVTSIGFRLGKQITGAINAYGMTSQGLVQSDVTNSAYAYYSGLGTAAASFTLSNIYHYGAIQGTFDALSTVTNQVGFYVPSGLTGATNNYAFSGNIAAATGRWNLHMGGTADNYLAGNTGIGGLPTANTALTLTGPAANTANPTLSIIGVSGSGSLRLYNDLSAGSYNNIVAAGSKGVIASGANSTTSRASFVIAPWSDVEYGIRFEGGSTTNILQWGTTIFQPSATTSVPTIVRGRASQTANLQEWQNSAGTVLAYIAADGSSSLGRAADDDQAIIASSVFS